MPMIWKFVDRPEASPTTLLDMNDTANGWKTLGDDFFKLPSPPLRRSIVTNNLTDGGLVTSANYDLRELVFTLELSAPTEAGRISQMDTLKRELAKPNNLLMYQPAAGSFPVFFRTLRSDQYELDNQFVPGSTWRVACNVLAQPYAIGIRHDIATGVVVQNDPANGTNPMQFDITGVRGDSPAPAFVQVGSGFGAGAIFTLAQRTSNNPTALTMYAQAESGTLGPDTTTQPNDAVMSGPGNNFIRCTFATDNNLTTRTTVTVPTATSPEALRGRYRVYVRVRRSGSSVMNLRYTTGSVNATFGPIATYSTAMPNGGWILDLGIVELPSPGPSPATIGYSNLAAGQVAQAIGIQAQRGTGAATLDLDFVMLVPADERQMDFQQVDTPQFIVLDGPNDTVYGMAAGSTPFDPAVANRIATNGGALMPRQGGIPMLVPGVTNRWYALRPTHNVNATSTWTVSYWPQWREVATS